MDLGEVFKSLSSINLLDAILIVLVLIVTIYGFVKGVVRVVGDLIGVLVGIWIAGMYFIPFYNWTQSLYMGYDNLGKVISFLALLIIARTVVSWLVTVVDKFVGILRIIPFLGLINRMAGALFGFLTASIVLGVFIYFASRYSLGFSLDKMLVDSYIVKFFLTFGEFVSPLLPEIIKGLHSLI